eukprot:516862-Amphidinium_carterae.1
MSNDHPWQALGDAAAEKQQWTEAERHFSTSLNDMKRLKVCPICCAVKQVALLMDEKSVLHLSLSSCNASGDSQQ